MMIWLGMLIGIVCMAMLAFVLAGEMLFILGMWWVLVAMEPV